MKHDAYSRARFEPGPEVSGVGGQPLMDTYVQRFIMAVEYPVIFTQDLFDPENMALVDTLSCREPTKRHRLFVVLDAGVAEAWPNLAAHLTAYAEHHADRIEILAVDVVMGGEAIKNQADAVDALLRRMLDLAVDRHSFVLAIGGGAVL
ncbi:MAG: hypothetical protein VCB63_09070, partial [Alphaproteobacteria bacterium]